MGLPFVLFISLVSGTLITAIYEKLFRGVKFSINGYHLHHSLYGIALICAAVFLYFHDVQTSILLYMVAFGLGSILQHTYSEHFVFIEKEVWETNLVEGWRETSETFLTRGIWITFYKNDKLLDTEENIVTAPE